MSNALITGVSGLRVHQQMLEVVGNNLANLNTTGFKSQRIRFADLVYQTLSQATSATSNRGGTNPLQIGLGVRVAAIDANLQQGSIESTGGEYDLSIQGKGFFVVNSGTRDLYTRAGAFGLDRSNFLVDPATGFRVQRTGTVGEGDAVNPAFQTSGDNSIEIPVGTSIPGRATTTIALQGNLSATAVGPLATTLTSSQPLLAGGAPATNATPLNSLDTNPVDYVAGDQILITGTNNGAAINATLTVANPPANTTVGSLLTAISAAFAPDATATLDAQGNIVLTANTTGPRTLTLTLADQTAPPNTGSTNWSQHAPVTTVVGKDGDTVNTAIQVFDTQGTARGVTLTFQKQGNNLWDLTASVNPSDGTLTDGQVTGLQFNDDGSFQRVNGTGVGDPFITLQVPGLTNPQTIGFSLGSPNGFDGLTQHGGPTSASALNQDGYTAGALVAVAVAKDGTIEGIFSNGQILPLAQLAIASFTNPGGLTREGDNYYSLSTESGLARLGAAGSEDRGVITQGSLEASNVDVALEFTRLITAQRGFQINARTITVGDQVLQELANILR